MTRPGEVWSVTCPGCGSAYIVTTLPADFTDQQERTARAAIENATEVHLRICADRICEHARWETA